VTARLALLGDGHPLALRRDEEEVVDQPHHQRRVGLRRAGGCNQTAAHHNG
jgi:hypothetical protein